VLVGKRQVVGVGIWWPWTRKTVQNSRREAQAEKKTSLNDRWETSASLQCYGGERKQCEW
jgi:hypothetical protein